VASFTFTDAAVEPEVSSNETTETGNMSSAEELIVVTEAQMNALDHGLAESATTLVKKDIDAQAGSLNV